MLDVRFTGQFKKDLAKVEKQNKQVVTVICSESGGELQYGIHNERR